MTAPTRAKGPTVAQQRAAKMIADTGRVMTALARQRASGCCPICGQPSKRVTCGTEHCIRRWCGTPNYGDANLDEMEDRHG